MVAQEMESAAALPPFQFQDYPVDVLLRIYREGSRYNGDFLGLGDSQRVPIDLSPHDLELLNKDLQEAIQIVTNAFIEPQMLTPEEVNKRLRSLAEAGHYAFKRVFAHSDAFTAIQRLLSASSRVSIQIATEDFVLPWELIYPQSLDRPLCYQNFWGMRYIISRVIVQRSRPGAFVASTIQAAQPKIGLLSYYELPCVSTKEVPFFQNLADKGSISLVKLRPLDSERRLDEIAEFKRFWNNSFDIAHFACHAFYEERSPDLSHIKLSNDFPITLRDMEAYEICIHGQPLIVMNACRTGNLNPLYTSNFVAAFLRFGARGIVATDCAVPDSFAADFIEELYSQLLAHKPLGESLLRTRKYFMEKGHNPSGLLYSMYGSPSIRFL